MAEGGRPDKIRRVTTSAPDLSQLRINRDVPAPVRRAFIRNVVIAGLGLAVLVTVLLVARRGSAVAVQVITVQATGGGGAGVPLTRQPPR